MERKLASVVKIKDVSPIQGADAIECVSVLGWKCVAKKGEFKVGDFAVYCEIDSLLPYTEWSKFLWKKGDEGKPTYRLRTVKLRGQISQGLIIPLPVVPLTLANEGADLTEMLGITKYEPPIPAQLAGKIKGSFPGFIPKTDETRVQAVPEVLDEIRGKMVYITTKMDGTSGTFYFNDEFGVCSRNLEFTDEGDNTYWKVAKKYDMRNKVSIARWAYQGEVCGPSIQKNRLGLKDHDLFIFNLYDIEKGKYHDYETMKTFCQHSGFKMVPVDYVGIFDPSWDIPKLLEMAKGTYPGTNKPREGIVIRPVVETHSEVLKGRLSFKVINNDFLLDGGD